MRKYGHKNKGSLFSVLRISHEVRIDSENRPMPTARALKASRIMHNLEPWEMHIPIRSETLAQWKSELPYHGNSSYAAILRRDIRLAEECNARGEEMLVSFKERQPRL